MTLSLCLSHSFPTVSENYNYICNSSNFLKTFIAWCSVYVYSGKQQVKWKTEKKTPYHLTWKGISHLIRGLLFWEQHKIIRFDIKLGRLAQKSNSNVFQYFRFEKTFLTFLGFGSICQLYVVVGHMMENIKWLADNRIETDTFCLTKRWRIFKQKQIAHFIGLTFLHKTHSLRSLNNLFLMKFVFLKYSGSEIIVFS